MMLRTTIGALALTLSLAQADAASSAAPALAKTSKEATASAALQKDFAAFIARFRAALKANDAAAITAMTKLPFEEDGADAAKFSRKNYPKIFTPGDRACIQRTKGVYNRDGNGNEDFFVFCGEMFFVFSKTQRGFLFTGTHPND